MLVRLTVTGSPAEQWQLPGELGIGEHGERTHLGNGFAHQYTRQRGPAREMAGEEPFVTGEMPASRSRNTRLERSDLVDEQERRAMR